MDIERGEDLEQYVSAELGAWVSDYRVLHGGVSNRTVMVTLSDGRRWVVKQALEKLRVKEPWYCDPERVHREALAMRIFSRLNRPNHFVSLVHEDMDRHIIVMEAVPEPAENWKTLLLAGNIDLTLVKQFASLLAQIHNASDLLSQDERELLTEQTYFQPLRIEPYYRFVLEQEPGMEALLNRAILEASSRHEAVVHGDFSPKNVLVSGSQIVLLDHEVIHLGDPGFDLGFALTHLLSKARHLPGQQARFIEAAGLFWQTYAERVAFPGIEERAVLHTLCCLMARVRGRSPLEYLSAASREQQRQEVLRLSAKPEKEMLPFIESYSTLLS